MFNQLTLQAQATLKARRVPIPEFDISTILRQVVVIRIAGKM
jgi:hypothetical protein